MAANGGTDSVLASGRANSSKGLTIIADLGEAASSQIPLRTRILADLGVEDGDREPTVEFLDASTVGEGLRQWFGEGFVTTLTDVDHLRRLLDREIAEIDDILNTVVNDIIHHPRYLALEANWRGIHWLCGSLSSDGLTILRVLNCGWNELSRDLERASDFDQSRLFDLVYNQEFGLPGGLPYALLIGLYEVQHRTTRDHPTDDISVMRRLTAVAAAAFAPILLGVRPALFGVDAFGELDRRASLTSTFRSQGYQRFNALRDLPDARFLGLVCPRILLRAPLPRPRR